MSGNKKEETKGHYYGFDSTGLEKAAAVGIPYLL